MKYEMHPLADVVPPMTEEEYEELKADIKAHGLCEPITLHQGKVIDGKHRYRACLELGIEPDTRKLSTNGSPLEYIISENVKRRHLTTGQRAALAVEIRPLIKRDLDEAAFASSGDQTLGEAKSPPNSRGAIMAGHRGAATRSAAAHVKVSQAAVEAYERVARETPDLAQKVRGGEMALFTAYDQARARDQHSKPPRVPTTAQLSTRARDAGQHFAKSVAALTNAQGDLTMMELWSIWAAIFEVQGYLEQIARKHQVAVPESPGDLKRLKPGS